MKVEQGLFYSKNHEWVKVDGDIAYIGITDYAQDKMGSIVFVELPEEDESFEEGDAFGVIESVKAASDVYLPIGGTVSKVNEDLEDEPEGINDDPYGKWIIGVSDFNKEDIDALMNADSYSDYLEGLDD